MHACTAAEGRRWVAATMPLEGVDPLAGADVLGVPSLYWERPLAREAAAGWGEAGAVRAENPREVGGSPAAPARGVDTGALRGTEAPDCRAGARAPGATTPGGRQARP